MILSRRALVATALTLPLSARAQTPARGPLVFDLKPGKLRLRPEPAAESPVWCINGRVPGPVVRVKKGEEVFVRLVNRLDQPTALHWQGVRIRNDMDGVAGLTQQAVAPGGSFDYRFTPPDAGTYWYRPSVWPLVAEQKGRGLYGLLIVDDPEDPPVDREFLIVLDDWRLDAGGQMAPFLDPADVSGEGRIGPLVSVNSSAIPQVMSVPPGARVRLRLLNACAARLAGLVLADMHSFLVSIDGQACAPFEPARGTLPAGPGARFDLIFDMPTEATARPALLLRGGGLKSGSPEEPDRELVVFTAEGAALPARPAVTSKANPILPSVIRLQDAKRLDLAIEASGSSDPRKTWTLNGVASSGTGTPPLFRVKQGQPVSLGFLNKTGVVHTIHIHGHVLRILHLLDDGWEPYWRDSIIVPPGRTARVAFVADNPGRWLVESTILDHAMSGLAGWFEVA